ncbi:tRNA (cytosine-5-)-methyltransferase, partial [Thraustotheca clavata]
MMACLETPLPVCFRLNLDGLESERLKKLFGETYQFEIGKYNHNGVTIYPPKPISWYPQDKTAWQVDCGRTAFSKSAHQFDEVRDFHACLLKHTEFGNIDRQEAVSMLPVLLLNVKPGLKILDMCASPGSKTTQIIDLLQNEKGMVVANDMNKKRAYMLVHRLSRNTLQSAVVTCSPGQEFPGLYDAAGQLQVNNVFDRVLCDVPCSGDGTLRKNQSLWRDWHIGQGLTLFNTQLQLALRGASLLQVGGTMVYSTCSFNPIEDEAVVAELLRRCNGALEIVDASAILPGLKFREGRTKWRVGWRSKSRATSKGHIINKVQVEDETFLHQWFDVYDEVPNQLQGDRIQRAMFPPSNPSM